MSKSDSQRAFPPGRFDFRRCALALALSCVTVASGAGPAMGNQPTEPWDPHYDQLFPGHVGFVNCELDAEQSTDSVDVWQCRDEASNGWECLFLGTESEACSPTGRTAPEPEGEGEAGPPVEGVPPGGTDRSPDDSTPPASGDDCPLAASAYFTSGSRDSAGREANCAAQVVGCPGGIIEFKAQYNFVAGQTCPFFDQRRMISFFSQNVTVCCPMLRACLQSGQCNVRDLLSPTSGMVPPGPASYGLLSARRAGACG